MATTTAPAPAPARPGRSASLLLSEALCLGLMAALIHTIGQQAVWAPPAAHRSPREILNDLTAAIAASLNSAVASPASTAAITTVAIAAAAALWRYGRGLRLLRVLAWYLPIVLAVTAALVGAWPAAIALIASPILLAVVDTAAATSPAA